MKYWSLYFSDYLEIINHDLSKLKASELIDYINIEEMLINLSRYKTYVFQSKLAYY